MMQISFKVWFAISIVVTISVLIYICELFDLVPWLSRLNEKKTIDMPNQQETAELVLVGDSITQWFQTDGRAHYKAHFYQLNPVNVAVAGDTTAQTIERLNDGILGKLKSAQVTTLLIGTNDIGWGYSAEDIYKQIGKIIQILQSKLPGTHILLLGVLPCRQSQMPGKVNSLIANYDNGNDVRFLDMTSQFTVEDKINPILFRPDKLHLSPEGYRVFAETIQPVIKEMIEDRLKDTAKVHEKR